MADAFGKEAYGLASCKRPIDRGERLGVLRRVARVLPPIDRDGAGRAQQRRERTAEQCRLGEERDPSRKGNENKRRIDQSVGVVKDEDDPRPTWDDIGIHRFDTSEEQPECDTKCAEDQPERERPSTVEDEIGER